MDFLKCCFPNNKESIIIINEEFSISNNNIGITESKADLKEEINGTSKNSNINGDNTSVNDKEYPNFLISTKKNDNNDYKSNNSVHQIHNNLTFNDYNNISNANNSHSNIVQINLNSPKNENIDDSFVEFINRVISDEECQRAPKLCIYETEGQMLQNTKLLINAKGLINGPRKARDGIVFFGSNLLKVIENITKGDVIINDYIINLDNQGNPDPLPHTFIIYYRKENNKYYIRNYKEKELVNNQIVLIKLENFQFIRKKSIIRFAETYFQIFTNKDQIEIEKLDSNSKDKERFRFNAADSPITIGRNKKCKISYPDEKAFSRVQTTIIFTNSRWEIKDGSDKPSTNGTWLYAQNSYEIQDGTLFRINGSLLKINIIEESNYIMVQGKNK